MNTYIPVSKQKFTSKQYLKLLEQEDKNIDRAEFVPPTLGKPGFGYFQVFYKHPKLVQEP